MKKKEKNKKINQIKIEQYNETEEIDEKIEMADAYYEDDIIKDNDNYIVEKNFSTIDIETEDEDVVYEDAKKTFKRINSTLLTKIFNFIFILIIIIMIVISIDVICVARYNIGPFFAIKTETYKDGGTEVYYGIGYKVIKYKQIIGRRDTQIGFWTMPYSITPTPIEDIDLAIEFQNNPEKTSKKYYKQYVTIDSKIKNINIKKNKLTLHYQDPDGKYTLEINCSMATENSELTTLKENQKLAIYGTIYKFALKDDKVPNTVFLSDCFIDPIIEVE